MNKIKYCTVKIFEDSIVRNKCIYQQKIALKISVKYPVRLYIYV